MSAFNTSFELGKKITNNGELREKAAASCSIFAEPTIFALYLLSGIALFILELTQPNMTFITFMYMCHFAFYLLLPAQAALECEVSDILFLEVIEVSPLSLSMIFFKDSLHVTRDDNSKEVYTFFHVASPLTSPALVYSRDKRDARPSYDIGCPTVCGRPGEWLD